MTADPPAKDAAPAPHPGTDPRPAGAEKRGAADAFASRTPGQAPLADQTATSLFRAVSCPVCGRRASATELYPAQLPDRILDPQLFSARRRPDRLHHRFVRCDSCGLVRSDPVLLPEVLAGLYGQATFDYQSQLPDLRRTYRRQLVRLLRLGASPGSLLEIGCGNGFLLAEAQQLGFAEVRGVEPSRDAVAMSPAAIRPWITVDVFKAGLFPPTSFDVVCMFQVFDHLPEPASVLRIVHEVLRPGGYVLLFNHNIAALSSRALREKSPIIDIEHTFLYEPRTIRTMLKSAGFRVLSVHPVVNRISLEYLAHLIPQAGLTGTLLARAASLPGVKHMHLTLPLGNLTAIGGCAEDGTRR